MADHSSGNPGDPAGDVIRAAGDVIQAADDIIHAADDVRAGGASAPSSAPARIHMSP